mgnify:CR=1 FL=1
MKKAYITALVETVLAGKPVESVLTQLKALMDKRGHSRLWSQVLKAAERELLVKERRIVPSLIVAQERGVSEDSIKEALTALGMAPQEPYHTSIDQTLVGGFTLRARGLLLDKSYKRALLKLYEQITK